MLCSVKNQVKLDSSEEEEKRRQKGVNLLPFSGVVPFSVSGFFLCDWLIVIQTMTKVEEKASESERERK